VRLKLKKRTEERVRGFSKGKEATRIGETSNFAVDFDGYERLVILYGKEVPKECNFKLAFNESETKAIIELLAKARALFHDY
jgi:hypothetical protein